MLQCLTPLHLYTINLSIMCNIVQSFKVKCLRVAKASYFVVQNKCDDQERLLLLFYQITNKELLRNVSKFEANCPQWFLIKSKAIINCNKEEQGLFFWGGV